MQSELEIISRVHQVGAFCARIEKPIWQEENIPANARHEAVALIADVARRVNAKIHGETNGGARPTAGSAHMRNHHRDAIEVLHQLEISEPQAAVMVKHLGQLEIELLGAIRRIELRGLAAAPQ